MDTQVELYERDEDGGFESWGAKYGKLIDPKRQPTFEELSSDFPEDEVPYLDKHWVHEDSLTDDQRHWRSNGFVIKEKFIPEGLVDEYLAVRDREQLGRRPFPDYTPYLEHEVIQDICCYRPLHQLIVDLIGEELGMHFNLTQFYSTERGWHQDDYLNPDATYSKYIAVWFAMGDIHPDCGPFEYVPGSHKWPCVRREKVKSFLVPEVRDWNGEDPKQPHWACFAESIVNKAYENQCDRTGLPRKKFLGKKGDVLLWHGRLMHRGSRPNNLDLERPGLITHYSSIRTRRDLGGDIRRRGDGGYYWYFEK